VAHENGGDMHKVSLRKIILNDYAAFLLAIGGPISLVIPAFTAAFGFIPNIRNRGGNEVGPEFIVGMWAVAVLVTVFLFWLLVRRIARIKDVVTNGVRARAKVLWISFDKDRGRVEYEYAYQGLEYLRGTAIMKNKETEAIRIGDEIEVAFDHSAPKRAFIPRLYCV